MAITRAQVLHAMYEDGVVAVVRVESSSALAEAARALCDGGVRCIEITMTTPNALHVIEQVSREMSDRSFIGVGTVLDVETARAAILAGACFVVCPVLNPDVIELCRRYSVMVVPGAFTPTEILSAWQAGADVVKVFPATALGPQYFKDVLAPLPQVRLSPTGGVNLDNTADFIRAGAVAVGVGSSLVKKQDIADQNWQALTDRAQQFVQTVRQAREG